MQMFETKTGNTCLQKGQVVPVDPEKVCGVGAVSRPITYPSRGNSTTYLTGGSVDPRVDVSVFLEQRKISYHEYSVVHSVTW